MADGTLAARVQQAVEHVEQPESDDHEPGNRHGDTHQGPPSICVDAWSSGYCGNPCAMGRSEFAEGREQDRWRWI
ncbi:hypothetical protein [Citricoccus nitrophenolicus]|uniref:hypothetical protein n=1 Tax=Citricoccus nitrophenolicus TaxID=863575 RepID=UPI0031ED2806